MPDALPRFGEHVEITPQEALLGEVARCTRFIAELEPRTGEPWVAMLAKERRRLASVLRTCRRCGIPQADTDAASTSGLDPA